MEERRAGVPEGPWRGGRGGHPVRPRTRAACTQLVLRQARAVCRGTAAPEGQGAGSRSPSLPPWALPPRGAEGWARLPWHPHQAPVPGADPGRRILASGEGQARLNSVSQGRASTACWRMEAEEALAGLVLFKRLSEEKRSV